MRGAGPVPFPLPADSRHIALAESSVDRLDLWRGRLRAAHVDFWEESHGYQQSLYFADPDDHVAKVATVLLEKGIGRLPVLQDGRLVGTVSRADICQAIVGAL